jgi:DNA-binding response OmpR family regulator
VARPRLVLVEDDRTIGASLTRVLAADHLDVTWVRDGLSALEAVDQDTALVLLDLGLPDLDGIEVCRRLVARWPHVPVIALTARREEMDVILGLDTGAVDYITKPFSLGELQARLRSQLRRRTPRDIRRVGSLHVDVEARRAWIGERELALRAKEFDLLAILSDRAGTVVSREDLMAEIWDEHWFGSTKTIDVHMVGLRRKLSDDAGDGVVITTVRGVGYRMEDP